MRNPEVKFDKLKMYFGEPYEIDSGGVCNNLVVKQPTIGDILRFGESEFYQTLNVFICNTTMYRLPLWKMDIDWNLISDFELFCIMYTGIDNSASQIIFEGIDFSKFEKRVRIHDDKEEIVLFNEESNVMIDQNIHNHFSQYLRNVFNIFPEEKLTSDKVMKEWFIRKDQRQLEINEEHKKDKSFSIQPIISACINHPGFKYKLQDLYNVGVCEFYDSVKRLQIYENSTALMKGMYSGFIDGSKIDLESVNFMRDIN